MHLLVDLAAGNRNEGKSWLTMADVALAELWEERDIVSGKASLFGARCVRTSQVGSCAAELTSAVMSHYYWRMPKLAGLQTISRSS